MIFFLYRLDFLNTNIRKKYYIDDSIYIDLLNNIPCRLWYIVYMDWYQIKDRFFYTFTFCIKYTKLLLLPSQLLSGKESLLKIYIQEMITFNDGGRTDIWYLSHLSDLPKEN